MFVFHFEKSVTVFVFIRFSLSLSLFGWSRVEDTHPTFAVFMLSESKQLFFFGFTYIQEKICRVFVPVGSIIS